jgi:hypothetical protein
MKATRTLAITLLGIAALGLAGWVGWAAFGPEGSESGRVFTYRNVSITLERARSGLHARAVYEPPESAEKPGGGPVIVIEDKPASPSGYLMVDANTGEVLVDTIGGDLRDEADELRASIREAEGDTAVWPLADVEAPAGPVMTWGNITYVEPDPGSGISIGLMHSDGLGWSSQDLYIHDRMSAMIVSGRTGRFEMRSVRPGDRDAFERLAEVISIDGIE